MISSGSTELRLDPPNTVDSNMSSRNQARKRSFSPAVAGFIFLLGVLSAREMGDLTSQIQPMQFDLDLLEASHLKSKESSFDLMNESHRRLPHWMVATRCSIYDLSCKADHVRDQSFQKYPLSDKELRESYNEKWINTTMLDSNENGLLLPFEWDQGLDQTHSRIKRIANNGSIDEISYLYPPLIRQKQYNKCLELSNSLSTTAQLDVLLESKVLTPEPDTNMIAFTITDWNYAYDMMHDVIQMADKVIGFSPAHFLVVSIDKETTELACKHGYSVIEWKPPAEMNGNTKENMGKGALRDAVANTKVVLSYEFVKRRINFFFTEMDVWWVRSPKQSLMKLRRNSDKDQYQMYFSTHQYHGSAPNIGVYAARANFKTELYFEICMELLAQRPDTHDQFVMNEVYRLFHETLDGSAYHFTAKSWKPNPPETPTINNSFAFSAYLWSPNEIASDERPLPTASSLAFHTLCGAPLLLPHGKKMIARELGVYYGFITPVHSDHPKRAGYYERSGPEYRRYIVLDSHLGTNILPSKKNKKMVEITMSILFTLAIHTERIVVMPQVAFETMRGSLFFLWSVLDYSNVEFLGSGYTKHFLDIRETNFLSNKKSWNTMALTYQESWPFESVATTALIAHKEDSSKIGDWTIWAQTTNKQEIATEKSWRVRSQGHHKGIYRLMDALFGSLVVTPEIKNSELLLVNLDSLFPLIVERFQLLDDPSPVEKEIEFVRKRLKWCWDNIQHPAFKASASHSCYRHGIQSV